MSLGVKWVRLKKSRLDCCSGKASEGFVFLVLDLRTNSGKPLREKLTRYHKSSEYDSSMICDPYLPTRKLNLTTSKYSTSRALLAS